MGTLRANTEENVSFPPFSFHWKCKTLSRFRQICMFLHACGAQHGQRKRLSLDARPRKLIIFPPPVVSMFPLQQSATSYTSFSRKYPHVTVLCSLSEIHIFQRSKRSPTSLVNSVLSWSGKSCPEIVLCKWSWWQQLDLAVALCTGVWPSWIHLNLE